MNNIPMRLRILIGAAIVLIPLSIWRVVSYRSDPAPNMTSEQAAIHEDRINGNVEGLVEKVKTYKTGNARRATIVLGTLGPAALPKLKTILREDTRPAVQEQAVYAIAEVVRSEVSVDKPLTKKMTVDLVEAMADEKIPPTVRAAAASSLGRIYDYNNMDSLLKAMDDKDLGVRISAHEAVSKIFGRKYKFDARVASAQRQIVIKEIAQAWETYKNRVGTYHDGNRKPAKR